MAKTDWPAPTAFDPTNEPTKAIFQVKAKLKKFRWSHAQSPTTPGRWPSCSTFSGGTTRRSRCRVVGRVPFDGTFNLWSGVSNSRCVARNVLHSAVDCFICPNCVMRRAVPHAVPDHS